jgi:hypothetical protein
MRHGSNSIGKQLGVSLPPSDMVGLPSGNPLPDAYGARQDLLV